MCVERYVAVADTQSGWRKPWGIHVTRAALIACVVGCGTGQSSVAQPIVLPDTPLVAPPPPTYVTLDSDCALVGLPARVGRALLVPSAEFGTPGIVALHLDPQPILSTEPDRSVGIEVCCDGDLRACEGFSLEVDESLVAITTLDVVPHRERNPPLFDDETAMIDEGAMLGGPSFAYCECGDESRTRTDSAEHCANGLEMASFLHVYAEFVVSGRRYRLLNDRQWDAFSVVPPRLERHDDHEWVLVSPTSEKNTQDEDCPRHHYRGGGFGAYWSEEARALVVGYRLEGPSQSHCEPGAHYVAYSL